MHYGWLFLAAICVWNNSLNCFCLTFPTRDCAFTLRPSNYTLACESKCANKIWRHRIRTMKSDFAQCDTFCKFLFLMSFSSRNRFWHLDYRQKLPNQILQTFYNQCCKIRKNKVPLATHWLLFAQITQEIVQFTKCKTWKLQMEQKCKS